MNYNEINCMTCSLNYILFKFYAQTEFQRLIEILIIQLYTFEQTEQINLIKCAIQTRNNMYNLLTRLLHLKTQFNQISTVIFSSNIYNVQMSYLSCLARKSRPIKYSPEQLKGILLILKQYEQSLHIYNPVYKKQKI